MADSKSVPNYPNYTVIGSNTPAAVSPGPTLLGAIIPLTAITGTVSINDSPSDNSGTLIFSQATPTVGTPIPLNFRTKKGAWLTPGTAGSVLVTWGEP